MPRAEVGTPKWVANRMKSKGLQRLRWYCQMCEKQCRDENGFKCHRMSEGHQRQMQVFSQRAGKYMDEFSREFEGTFMQLMRTRYCRTRVLANTVYNELIADKQHIHMNATIWTTLSEFVLHLKRTNQCNVEHTDRGWVMEYIDKEKIRREAEADSKRKAELTAEQRRERQLTRQVEAAWEEKKKEVIEEKKIVPFQRQENQPILFKMSAIKSATTPPVPSLLLSEERLKRPSEVVATSCGSTKKLTVLEKLMLENEKKKQKTF